jgi:uncharacterized metal-binding protein YceD (DUF177 family)
MIRGSATFAATLPCVVTLDPVTYDLRPEIFLLLRQAPKTDTRRQGGESKPDPRAGKRKRRAGNKDADQELSEEGSAQDTFDGDEIVLDDLVREFVLLELPLYPRRPDLPSPEESIVSRPLAGPAGEPSIDPRLEPLAKIAERLRGAANKE